MKNPPRLLTLAVAFGLAMLAGRASAAPILDISLDPNPIRGSAGTSVPIYYTIANSSETDAAQLQNVSVSVEADLGEFVDMFDFPTIGPNGARTGLLGTFEFAVGAPTGRHLLAFAVDIGFTWTDGGAEFDGRAAGDFDVEVTTPVPEPATFTVTLLGLGLAIRTARRRR